jgi:hypothetical protein
MAIQETPRSECQPCKQKGFDWKDKQVIYQGTYYTVHSFDTFNSLLFLRDADGNKVNIKPNQVEGFWETAPAVANTAEIQEETTEEAPKMGNSEE